jgi:hypothetical protein
MRLTDADRARIHKLRALGWTQAKIAAEIGCSDTTVGMVLDPAIAERDRETNRAWRAANPDYDRAWDAAHPIKVTMHNARWRAKKLGVPFNSDIEQELGEPPTHCPVCQVEMIWHKGEGIQQSDSPSIDRRTPALGYVPGNVSWLCMRCNQIKGDRSMSYLRDRLTLASYLRDRLTLAS